MNMRELINDPFYELIEKYDRETGDGSLSPVLKDHVCRYCFILQPD